MIDDVLEIVVLNAYDFNQVSVRDVNGLGLQGDHEKWRCRGKWCLHFRKWNLSRGR